MTLIKFRYFLYLSICVLHLLLCVVVSLGLDQRLHWCVSHLENSYIFFGARVQALFVSIVHVIIELNCT